MDFVDAVKYPLNDKNWWLKCLVMGLCTLFLVTSPIAVGYALRAARRAALDPNSTLPELEDWGGLFVDGLIVYMGSLIHLLPGIAVVLVAVLLGGGLTSINYSNDTVAWSLLLILCGCALGIILSLAGGILFMASYLFLMRDCRISSCLNLSNSYNLLFSNFGSIAMFIVFWIVLDIAIGLISPLTFGLGTIIATPYALLIMSALYGQLYRGTGFDASL